MTWTKSSMVEGPINPIRRDAADSPRLSAEMFDLDSLGVQASSARVMVEVRGSEQRTSKRRSSIHNLPPGGEGGGGVVQKRRGSFAGRSTGM